MDRLVTLDIIRIFACLCILVIHFNASVCGFDLFSKFVYDNGIFPSTLLGGVYLGNIGVGLFFILSGASLQYSKGMIAIKDYKKFIKGRIKAIYPQYWIAFAVSTLVSFLWYKGMTNSALENLVVSILGMDGYSLIMLGRGCGFYQVGEWFLGCIIILYLFFPFLSEGINKYPIVTILLTAVLYLSTVNIVREHWFWLQVPYLLLGTIYVRFLIAIPKVYVWIPTIVFVLIRIVFSKCLAPLSIALITNWALFLAFVTFFDNYKISSVSVKSKLAYFSDLTYPAFLVHHKLIILLASVFNLQYFPYRYTVMLFLIYLIFTFYLSQILKKYGKQFTDFLFQNNKLGRL